MTPIVRAATVAALLALAGPAPRAAVAQEAAPADTLDAFLEELSGRRDDEFDLEALTISDAEVDSLMRAWEATGESPYEPPPRRWRAHIDPGGVRYDRVEGLNARSGVRLGAPTPRLLEAFGQAGWAWAAGEATWRAGLRAELLARGGRPTLEVAHARDYLAYGSGGILGNTVSALFLGYDWGDYFRAEGWSATLTAMPGRFLLQLGGRIEDQTSAPKETDFSFFEGADAFRPNPAIDDGEARTVEATAGWGDPRQGRFAARLHATKGGDALGGDFDWESVDARLVVRRTLPDGDLVGLELRGGAAGGEPPFQALAHLGGFATLRGYDVNEFPARRWAHARLDWAIGTDVLAIVPWVRRLHLQLVPFADAGAVFETQTRDGAVVRLDEPDLRTSAGVGVQTNPLGIPGGAGQFRFDVTRRLDRAHDDWTWRAMLTAGR
jgi:hypothetical protein